MRTPRRISAASRAPCRQAARRKGRPRSSRSFRRPGHPSVASPAFQRGAPAAGFQPQYRPQPPRGYSPIGLCAAATPVTAQRSFNGPMSQPPSGEPRLQTPRVNPDAYRRGPQDDFGLCRSGLRNLPALLAAAHRALLRAPAYDDDYGDEIFEDAPASRSRAGPAPMTTTRLTARMRAPMAMSAAAPAGLGFCSSS